MRKTEIYEKDLVSVIMPAFNSAAYVSDAVNSVVDQTYKKWELIICDDKSTDNTLDMANALSEKDKRIKVITAAKNSGVAAARNTAIAGASGEYIAFLDSDDIWAAEKLQKQISFMKKNDCPFSYTSYGFIAESGGKIKGRTAPIKPEANYNSLLKDNFTGTLTIVIDRTKIGDIRFSSKRHEDLILWLEIAKRGFKMMGIDEILAFYRVSGSSLSGNKIKAALWRWKVYRESEGLGVFESTGYMFSYICNSILKRVRK